MTTNGEPRNMAEDMPTNGSGAGLTIKELILSVGGDVKAVSAKLDAFIQAHQIQHTAEAQTAMTAMSDPQATVAGRALLAEVHELMADKERDHSRITSDIEELQKSVALIHSRHESEDAVESQRRRDAQFRLVLIGIAASLAGSTIGVVVGHLLS